MSTMMFRDMQRQTKTAFERRRFLGFLLVGAAVFAARQSLASTAPVEIKVYKDPACGCCSAWVKHIEANGFVALVENRADLVSLKHALGVPDDLGSCHTAVVEGYVLEGHVPAADVHRLLETRPAGIHGLAVSGMPLGSPGMEEPGGIRAAFTVIAFRNDGSRMLFARYPART